MREVPIEVWQARVRLDLRRLENTKAEIMMYVEDGKAYAYLQLGWITTPIECLTP